MSNTRTVIEEDQLGRMSHGRASLEPGAPDMYYHHAEVRFILNLQQVNRQSTQVYVARLVFTDVVFHQRVSIGGQDAAGRVIFNNCQFMSAVWIETLDNVNIDDHCIFHNDLEIASNGRVHAIGPAQVAGTLSLNLSGHTVKLDFVNSTLDENGNQPKDFAGILMGRKIRISSSCELLTMNASGGEHVYIEVAHGNKRDVKILGCSIFELSIDILGGDVKTYIQESSCRKIRINCKSNDKAQLSASYCQDVEELVLMLSMFRLIEIYYSKIKKLVLRGNNSKESVVELDNSSFEELMFRQVINEGLIALRHVTIPATGTLTMISSNLGKAEFINCDLSAASLEFENSRLTEVFLAKSEFPRSVTWDKKPDPSQARLAFGQLRTASDKQGDTVMALEYQSREIEAHYKNLRSFWYHKFPYIHFTKLNLALNYLSNDFGRDWGRGIVFSLLVGLLCFTGLIWTTQEYSLHGEWHLDPRLIASFVRFMNPLRFFDLEMLFSQNGKAAYVTVSAGSHVLDFAGRILVAYGYYQTIQAFRRYGRK